jgi:four helix bundle protein
MALQKVTDLILWQKSMDFAESVYLCTHSFPKTEIYGFTKQVRSAAVSIPSNVAEGYEQLTTGNFIRFLGIAKGSLAQVETQLHLACRLKYLDQNVLDGLLSRSSEIGRLLHGLLKALRRNQSPPDR